MSEADEIPVEEETTEEKNEESTDGFRTEEFKVKGEELLEAVKRLAGEAGVRRMVIMSKSGKVLLEIPVVLGLAGVLLLPTYAAIALVAALVTECSIVVERAEKTVDAESSVEDE
jgi:hypothetical protein